MSTKKHVVVIYSNRISIYYSLHLISEGEACLQQQTLPMSPERTGTDALLQRLAEAENYYHTSIIAIKVLHLTFFTKTKI